MQKTFVFVASRQALQHDSTNRTSLFDDSCRTTH